MLSKRFPGTAAWVTRNHVQGAVFVLRVSPAECQLLPFSQLRAYVRSGSAAMEPA
jgi:hypothetical protein